jgi:hypothetical protein
VRWYEMDVEQRDRDSELLMVESRHASCSARHARTNDRRKITDSDRERGVPPLPPFLCTLHPSNGHL